MKTRTSFVHRARIPALLATLAAGLPFAQAQQAATSTESAGQTAPTSSNKETDTEGEEVVVLSPFTVSTEKDKGYLATNSISGSRLNTPIKEIPMPIEVITEKFVRDTGSTDLRESLRYSAGILLQSQNDQGTPGGAYQGPGSVNNPEGATANKTQTSFKIRGYVTDAVLRDGYRRQNATDSVNLSRIEVVRGPAAILYGIGQFGGIVNYLPKLPESKAGGSVGVTVGSYDFYRGTFDATGPIGSKLGYRFAGALQSSGDHTQYRTEDHYFLSGMLTFKPFDGTDIILDYENGEQWQDGVGFQRVRASANVGIGNDQNEHSGFWNLPGTNPRTFRWSGPDTYLDTAATNLRLELTQRIIENMYFKVGYQRGTADFKNLDVQGNLMQNQGPASMRGTVNLSPIDQVNGSSNLNIVFGPLENVTLQYFWVRPYTDTQRDQVRAEWTYNFKLFEKSSKWLQLDNAFLVGRSEERGDNAVDTWRTPDNRYNYKNPNDTTPIRIGTQGDGSPDVGMIHYNGNKSTAWNQGLYAVYQGKMLDDRVTAVVGARRDRNVNAQDNFNYVSGTSTSSRSETQKQRTYQYGASVKVTKDISFYALQADGLQPNFSGGLDTNGNALGAIMAKSHEYGLKVDLFNGRVSGTISKFKIERTGTPIFYWWAPTSNYSNFDPSRPIIYNVNNFSPSSAPGGSNGGNGAADAALTQWNAGVSAGAIYQKVVGGTNNWYVNASQPTGAAYLDAVFDYTKSHNMSWPGWLYIYDDETNNSWNDRASSPDGNEYVVGSDSSDGWDAQITFSPTDNLQVVATYAHINRVIDSAGQFARSPNPQDRWAVWYFPNTDWGLTGKPLDVVYRDADDTSTWTGIGYGTGEKQDDTPKHQVSVWSNYSFREGRLKGLSLGLGGWWESPREYMSGITHGGGQRVTDRNGNLVVLSTDDRYNVDLMARYQFLLKERDAWVQLNVSNLFDDQELYGLIYAAPRSVRFEFGMKF